MFSWEVVHPARELFATALGKDDGEGELGLFKYGQLVRQLHDHPTGEAARRDTANLVTNLEGCKAGMLIMKHVGKSGMESVVLVGSSATFTAPEDGEISYRINDTTFYDNTWKQSGSVIDHTSIEVSPAE